MNRACWIKISLWFVSSLMYGSSLSRQSLSLVELRNKILMIETHPRYDTYALEDLLHLISSDKLLQQKKYRKSLSHLKEIIAKEGSSYQDIAFIKKINLLADRHKVTKYSELSLLVNKDSLLLNYYKKNISVKLKSFLEKNIILEEKINSIFFSSKNKKIKNFRKISAAIDGFCSNTTNLSKILESSLLKDLNKSVVYFVKAKSYMCKYKDVLAKKMFYKSYKEIKSKDYINKISVLDNQAKIYRRQGLREQAARVYVKISNNWIKNIENLYKIGEFEDIYAMNNHLIWTARYQSLIGKQKLAKLFIKKSFKELKKSSKHANSYRKRKRLNNLKAESYYILSFKIYLQEKRYKLAQETLLKALNDNEISTVWKKKFRWVRGLYFYATNQYNQALLEWKLAFRSYRDKRVRSKISFWIVRALAKQGKYNKDYYYYLDKLKSIDPAGFYYLTFLSENKESLPKKISFFVNSYSSVFENFHNKSSWVLNSNRFKLLTRLKMYDYLNYEVSKFRRQEVRSKPRDNNHLYNLASFFYSHELYYQNIILVGGHRYAFDPLFSKYPNTFSYLYPRPFFSEVKRRSKSANIDPYLLYAIARQESLFNPYAMSPVGARGLMQLMPKTAKKHGLKNNSVQSLLDPETNIKIAANYLKSLHKKYKHKEYVLAAYNAGEYVVDMWAKYNFSDPLLWVEFIAFFETRKYVKSVMRHNLIYKSLYQNNTMLTLK
jgi:soluble lytic murein transglycosylase-like protein